MFDTRSDLGEVSQQARHRHGGRQSDLDGAAQSGKRIIPSTPYMDGRATMRGYFKAYAFFLL